MQRLIDANELRMSIILPRCGAKTIIGDAIQKMIDSAPTVDAIPISFIEEQVKLCNEVGFRRGEECYMALIEKWREKK